MFIKYLAKFYLNMKFHGTINDPLPVLPGNELQTFLPKTGVPIKFLLKILQRFGNDLVMMQVSSKIQVLGRNA